MEKASSDTGSKKQSLSSSLANLSRNELLKRDIYGRTILHLIILANRYDLIRHLLKNPHMKSLIPLTDYENGWNCLHYCIFHKRICCLRSLYENLQQSNNPAFNNLIPELLKTKDRNRCSPLHLLQNDFKDMIWFPDYITESDQIKLSFRYPESNSDMEAAKGRYTRQQKATSHIWWDKSRGGSDLLMLGLNINNNLGVGDSNNRISPARISQDNFKASEERNNLDRGFESMRFRQIKISKYHSVVLTTEGHLYSCGLGSQGRLGYGPGRTQNSFKFHQIQGLSPQDFSETGMKVTEIAISRNHSLALTSNGRIFSWGLNDFNQLGMNNTQPSFGNYDSNEKFESTPKQIVAGDIRKLDHPILGLAVSNVHSTAFTKHKIISWGLNIGQMGLKLDGIKNIDFKSKETSGKGGLQVYPKAIELRDEIKYLSTCDTCTCFVTNSNDIHVYYRFQHIKLPKLQTRLNSDKDFDYFKPGNISRPPNIIKIVMNSHRFIAILTDSGQVWGFCLTNDDIRNTKYYNIWKSYDEEMKVSDLDIGSDGSILLCTRNGHVFYKSSQNLPRRNSISDVAIPMALGTKTKFKRIEALNRIVQVSCDEKFSSFSFIRDEIDLLPLKLMNNSFFEDMAYLGIDSIPNPSRKQDKLYKSGEFDTYVSDFIYAREKRTLDITSLLENLAVSDTNTEKKYDAEDKISNDKILKKYVYRYDPTQHKIVAARKTFQQVKTEGTKRNIMEQFVKYLSFSNIDEKLYDASIKVKNLENASIPFHRYIFIKRFPLCRQMFESTDTIFQDGEVLLRFDKTENCILFDYDVSVEAIILLIQSAYNSGFVDIGHSHEGEYKQEELRRIRKDYTALMRAFNGSHDIRHNVSAFANDVKSLIDDESGDIAVSLSNGTLRCHSAILIARSAYFETMLSTRWHRGKKTFRLENVTKDQFMVILRHLYGYNNHELFSCLPWDDVEACVSFIIDLIIIVDELLLIDLVALCQLAIKDFINTENVVSLVIQAYNISASKIFLNCCWLIYNNLEIFLFDDEFNEIPIEVLNKIEEQLVFFHRCKHADMTESEGCVDYGYKRSWIERKSNTLITKFIYSLSEYNENFISDRKGCFAFEPLIDVRSVGRGDTDSGVGKTSSRSRSSTPSNNDLMKFRQSVKSHSQGQVSDEDAIDDSFKDFETVENRKRRKSKAGDLKQQETNTGERQSISSHASRERIVKKSDVSPNSSAVSIESPSLQPFNVNEFEKFYQWGSRRKSSLSLEQQPVLGENFEESEQKRKIKKFIAPVRISQKERKKKASFNNPVSEDGNRDSMTWSVPASSSSSVSSLTNDLPVLGSMIAPSSAAAKKKPSKSDAVRVNRVEAEALGLSVEDIVLQESLISEMSKQKISDKSSLAEIQQEQEFAKWWEQETARVQKQLGKKTPHDKDKSKKTDKKPGKKPCKAAGPRKSSPRHATT